jgi:hypothetical protein
MVSAVGAAEPEARPRIDPLEVQRLGDSVQVAFRLTFGLAEEEIERLHSGLAVTHRHVVEVLGRRPVPLWPAREQGRLRVETTAVFDSLTGRYELTRTLQVGLRKNAVETVENRSSTSLDDVRAWMTVFEDLPPLDLEPTARDIRLRVRVESTLWRHFFLYLFPAKLTVSAERALEPA